MINLENNSHLLKFLLLKPFSNLKPSLSEMHVKEIIFHTMVNFELFLTTNLQIMVSFSDDFYVIQYQTSQLLFRMNIHIKILDSKYNKIKSYICEFYSFQNSMHKNNSSISITTFNAFIISSQKTCKTVDTFCLSIGLGFTATSHSLDILTRMSFL